LTSRGVINLPELSAVGLSAADLGVAIEKVVDACDGGIDEKIIRLVVRDVPRHVLRDLDHKSNQEFQRRALHFLLDASASASSVWRPAARRGGARRLPRWCAHRSSSASLRRNRPRCAC
jgi:hypothetical protein